MDSCSLSWSTSYFAEIARPSRVLALSPFCKGNFTSFSAFASSACSGSSYFCAQPWGTAKAHATRNATAIVARGLVASELAIMQISLVDDLRHDFHAPVLDPEPLDQRLERAVLAVVAEVGAKDIERDALPRGVGRISKREFCLRIVETPDEPGGCDAVDVRPRSRHPRAPMRMQRHAMSSPGRPRSCLCGAQACGGGLPELSGPRAGWRVQIVDRLDAVQLALEAIQRAAQLRDRAVVRQVAIQLGEDLPATLHDRLVLDAPRLVKERSDLLLRP